MFHAFYFKLRYLHFHIQYIQYIISICKNTDAHYIWCSEGRSVECAEKKNYWVIFLIVFTVIWFSLFSQKKNKLFQTINRLLIKNKFKPLLFSSHRCQEDTFFVKKNKKQKNVHIFIQKWKKTWKKNAKNITLSWHAEN